MIIKDGEIILADPLLNTFGTFFKNTMQNIWRNSYVEGSDISWNTGGFTGPNFKRLIFSTLQSNSADKVFNAEYNATNELYQTIDLSSATLVYFDIYATSVNTSTLTDVGNGVRTIQIDDNIWRLYSSSGTVDKNINSAITILFDGLGSSATDPNGVTGLTDLRCSEATYQDHNVRFVSLGDSSSGNQNSGVEFVFGSSVTYFYIGDFLISTESNSSGALFSFLRNNSGTIHTQESDDPGFNTIDDRNTSTIHSVAGTGVVGSLEVTRSGGSGNKSGNIRTPVLYPSSTTFTTIPTLGSSGSYSESGDILISATAPDTATFPLEISTVIFKNIVAETVVNTVTTTTTVIDPSSTLTILISYDGGSNFETFTDSTIQRNSNPGTEIQLKFTITRTDLTKIDEIREWATLFNLGE